MNTPSPHAASRLLTTMLLAMLAAVAAGPAPSRAADAPNDPFAGTIEFDAASDFSHIRIRRHGNIRSMLFVRDTGEEVLESQVDFRKPHVLQFEYLRFLFTSYLLRDQQQDVLIVGLGGGGMIHFLQHLDPKLRIDAVEIDPLVVRLADEFFNVRTAGNVHIITADGLKYLAETDKQYDAVYMDAFLKPSAGTDGTGAPLALRTRQFYQQMQQKLKPGGVVAFNLNPHPDLDDDIRMIAEVFPQVYVFPLSRNTGAVVIASTQKERLNPADMLRRGRTLDRRFKTTVQFADMARRVQK